MLKQICDIPDGSSLQFREDGSVVTWGNGLEVSDGCPVSPSDVPILGKTAPSSRGAMVLKFVMDALFVFSRRC